MERLPPLCLVRIKPGVRMFLLGPGEVGYVTCYGDVFGNAGVGEHVVVLRRNPKRLPNGQEIDGAVCGAEQLEVVGYRSGLTPQFVRETFQPN